MGKSRTFPKERFFAYVSSDETCCHMDRETIEVIGRLTKCAGVAGFDR